MKPSSSEEEYFLKHEAELAKGRHEELLQEERVKMKAQYFMKWPKDGSPLETVRVGCTGIWLDASELEAIDAQDSGFPGRLFKSHR